MSDAETYLHTLEITNPLMEPVMQTAIQALTLPLGSRGLDAGCGIGLQAVLLAKAVGPTGHVTGLDISSEFLDYAAATAHELGLSRLLSFQAGDVRQLPFDDHAFDWAWSANCVGYAPLEPLPLIKELARVVRPGGSVAILAWSSETLLPGYPALEARLAATSAGIAPFVKGQPPDLHYLRALGWFREAGLKQTEVRTFAGDAYAPLSDELRQALIAILEMRWPGAESELSPEERAEYRRLCRPESSEFILNHPDYGAFFTCTMFRGHVAG